LRNYLKRENGNIKEDGMEIDGHHTSKKWKLSLRVETHKGIKDLG